MHKLKKQLMKSAACISAITMVSASLSSVSLAKELEDVNNPVVIEASEELVADETTETADESDVPAADESEEEVTNEDSEETDVKDAEETDADETDAEETNAEEADAEETNAEETDAEESDAEDSEEIDAEDSEVIDAEDADAINPDSEEELDSEEALIEEEEVKEAVELAVPTNGWYQDENGDWYYYQKGKAVKSTVMQINGNYYGFNSNGVMYNDTTFSMYKDGKTRYYRAKEGGTLYVKEWYEYYSSWYYYGEAGVAPYNEVLTINNTLYLFGYAGSLQKNNSMQVGDTWYASDENGHAFKLKLGGWSKIGSYYYYVYSDGTVPSSGFQTIGGKKYYFNYGGRAAGNDDTFSVYDSETGTYIYYRAKSDCSLYVNEWYKDQYGSYYWYGAGGKAPKDGTVGKVGTHLYIFGYAGQIFTNYSTSIDGVAYVTDNDGYATKVKNKTWTKVGDYYYYAISGELLKSQIKKIDGSYYGFDSSGHMYEDRAFSLNSKYYYANKGGRLAINEWSRETLNYYGNEAGWYYYGSDGALVSGWKEINGAWYYLAPYMLSSCYYLEGTTMYRLGANGVAEKITSPKGLYYDTYNTYATYFEGGKLIKSSWKEINGKWYYFDADGRPYVDGARKVDSDYYFFNEDGTLAMNGWVKSYGSTYYAGTNGKLYKGEQKIGDKWYYFSSTGEMQRGCVKYNKKCYILNPDGSYWMEAKTGWNKAGSAYYYVKSGNFIKSQTLEIDGNYYIFDANGIMRTDVVADSYLYGASGKRITQSGWNRIGQYWYYVGANSKILTSTTKVIDGTVFGFDYNGKMLTNTRYNGYYFDEFGHGKKEETVQNGWVLSGGKYYYYKNGKKLEDQWVGEYYLDWDGAMSRNRSTPDGYYVGDDGKYLKGLQLYKGYIAVKADNKVACNEWVKINGKSYYAYEGGYVYHYKFEVIDGALYQFNNNYDGKYPDYSYVKTITSNAQNDTWYQVGSDWVYIVCGQVADGVVNIKGTRYYFSNGTMQKNTMASVDTGIAYFGADGKEDKTVKGWKNGYYYGEDHKADVNWVQVNGKLYYSYSGTGSYHRSPYELINGILYKFNSDGSLSNEVYKASGWLQLNGQYYYFKDGKAVTGFLRLGERTYALNSSGVLVKDCVVSDSSTYNTSYYYINSGGYIDEKAGFRTINGEQYYFDSKGKALTGIQKINGKVYYFPEYVRSSYSMNSYSSY